MAWVVVVGNKLGYTEKEIGHMTYRKFCKLYKAYRDTFDLELAFTLTGKGYWSLASKSIDEIIPF